MTFEANDRLGYGLSAHGLTMTRVSAAKQGMKPAIDPNRTLGHIHRRCPLQIQYTCFKAYLVTTIVPIWIK
jgi:hypothetical protein